MDLEVNHIGKKYGKKSVLQDVSISASKGECIGILGGNGSGKTTLLSILAGILTPDKGEILWEGEKLSGEKIGYVPQGIPLFEELSAMDNLRLWYSKKTVKKELESGVLNLLGIPDFIHVPVKKMSGGMKKRLSIGCAVAQNPPLLLLDEPTAALDLLCKQKIWEYLSEYLQQGGTVLLVTHDVWEIEKCTRCYIAKEGKFEDYSYCGNIDDLVGQLQ